MYTSVDGSIDTIFGARRIVAIYRRRIYVPIEAYKTESGEYLVDDNKGGLIRSDAESFEKDYELVSEGDVPPRAEELIAKMEKDGHAVLKFPIRCSKCRTSAESYSTYRNTCGRVAWRGST